MFDQTFQKVYTACGILFAAAVQDTLEGAGIPTQVRVSKNSAGLEIQVPAPQAETAENLLRYQFSSTPALS